MRAMRAAAAATIAAGGAAWSLPALAPLVPSLCRALAIERTIDPTGGGVAVTFDDGPHPQGTPAVLDALGQAGATATFFLVGEQVRRWPQLARRIADDGHAIALHGDRHRLQLRVPPGRLAADLDRGHAQIADATGVAPSVYRPPYGIFSPAGMAIAARRGWRPMLWSRWGRDWRGDATARSVADTVATGVQAGDVLLLHDADHYSDPGCWRATAGALPAVLERIAQAGLRTVAL
jgi:peptidoglycan/xylan/chitin deacetylase (PgdA/CDA1 family)